MWTSRRSNVMGRGGAVASDNPLATQAGLEVLRQGGTAADAAVAVGALLSVTQPCTCGIGGDLWVLHYEAKTAKVTCLDATGRSAAAFTPEKLATLGCDQSVHSLSALNITVPGAVDGWFQLKDRFGKPSVSMQSLLQPAIQTAEVGFPVGELISDHWSNCAKAMQAEGYPLEGGYNISPRPGQLFQNSGLASAYKELASAGRDGYYRGRIGRDIVEKVQSAGGLLTQEDLDVHTSTWVDPISVEYRPREFPGNSFRIWEPPLNSQAIVTLEALNLLEALEFPWSNDRVKEADYYHAVMSALAVSFDDLAEVWAKGNGGKPGNWDHMLSKDYARKRGAGLMNRDKVVKLAKSETGIVKPDRGDTSYFCVTDRQGNACSCVYSNYSGFGTPYVPGNWGFTLHNRGHHFWEFMGRKFQPATRPFHTLMAGMITAGGEGANNELLSSFGVMGGQNQPQGHLQVLLAMLEMGCSPQQALDRTRVRLTFDFDSRNYAPLYECGISQSDLDILRQRGHQLGNQPITGQEREGFGRGHIITRSDWWNPASRDLGLDQSALRKSENNAMFWAGSDPRSDGCALALLI